MTDLIGSIAKMLVGSSREPRGGVARRQAMKLITLGMMTTLAGCGRQVRSRFKLTLVLDTPDGVKSASGVIQSLIWDVSYPMSGAMHALTGEALYVDLGPGRRPLVALLTKNSERRPIVDSHGRPTEPKYWSNDGGPMTDWVLSLYGEAPSRDDFLDKEARLARYRGARDIPPEALPDLATFADVADPTSVLKVDPHNLEATLGPGVRWRRITLEMTDEPVTTGIEKRLPWLAHQEGPLGGSPPRGLPRNEMSFAQFLNYTNFIKRER